MKGIEMSTNDELHFVVKLYSRSELYCAGVLGVAGSVVSSGLAATTAVPFLS